MIEMKM